MKENRYDDPVFFRKYSEMARSKLGLEGAGEWKTLRPMLPGLYRQTGAGPRLRLRLARLLRRRKRGGKGPRHRPVGEDAGGGPGEEYLSKCPVCSRRDGGCPLSGRQFRRRPQLPRPPLCEGLRRTGVPGLPLARPRRGLRLFGRTPDLHRLWEPGLVLLPGGGDPPLPGRPGISTKGSGRAVFLGEKVIKYHRTVDGYLKPLWQAGFTVEDLSEPRPPEEMMDPPRHEGRDAPPDDAPRLRPEAAVTLGGRKAVKWGLWVLLLFALTGLQSAPAAVSAASPEHAI